MSLLRLLSAAVLAAGLAAGAAAAASLQESLLAYEGRFDWDAQRQDYIFSDRPGLAALIEPLTEEKLSSLVGCIDDPRLAAARLDGRPATLGAMCYQALRLLAYVEAANWPGHIGAAATPEQRRAAKEAWQAALVQHSYVLH